MTPTNKQPDPYIGRAILNGQFLIEQKIGSGGMGAVYRASQPSMSRAVAVKILHPKLTNRKDLASRFRREASALSHLQHPNTVRVHACGEIPEDGSLYIVMEYLEGRNLNQTVRKEGPLPVDRAVPILIQCCGALHEAHSQGIVHRDLKPENIFLSTNGGLKDYPKVLDFGLAKVTERELRPGSIMLTREGMVFGTPEFMSPEQAQGKVLDARSDIYSLATILYEVLTGKLPFDAKTPMEYIQLHVTKPPIPLDDRVPGKRFPGGLGDVIARALHKKPEDRYATAADFAEALKPYAMGRTFSAIMPGGKPTIPAAAPSTPGAMPAARVQGHALEPTQNDAPQTPRGGPEKRQVAKTVKMEASQLPVIAEYRPRGGQPPSSGPGAATPPGGVYAADPRLTTSRKKGPNIALIVVLAVLVLVGGGVGVYFGVFYGR